MKFFALIALFTAPFANAIEIKITGACSEAPIHHKKIDIPIGMSVGAATIKFLEENNIEYFGAEQGINSIEGSPVGRDAIEIVNRETLRAYGWCYLVNGFEPNLLANEYFIDSQTSVIHWFFAYSTNTRNEWLNYCKPSYELKPDFLCKIEKE